MRIALPTRARRLGITLLAAAGLVATAAAGPAAASPATSDRGHGGGTYLALGDSVPFGFYNAPYDPVTQPAQYAAFYSDPSRFRSYADDVAAAEHLRLVNASCPGETSGSFIDPTVDVFKCEGPQGYRTLFPLHVSYPGSQLAYAERFLSSHRDVRLVTLQIGANDGFLCQAQGGCTTPAQLAALAAKVGKNVDTILTGLRSTGYRGRIDVVDYYALNYADAQATAGTVLLNSAIDGVAAAHHDTVVSGFNAFLPIAWARGAGDSRAAGLVRPAPDVHPTPFGHAVLAAAVELADQRIAR